MVIRSICLTADAVLTQLDLTARVAKTTVVSAVNVIITNALNADTWNNVEPNHGYLELPLKMLSFRIINKMLLFDMAFVCCFVVSLLVG